MSTDTFRQSWHYSSDAKFHIFPFPLLNQILKMLLTGLFVLWFPLQFNWAPPGIVDQAVESVNSMTVLSGIQLAKFPWPAESMFNAYSLFYFLTAVARSASCTDVPYVLFSPSSLSFFHPCPFHCLHPFLFLATSFHLNLPHITGHRGSNRLKCSGWQWVLMRNLPVSVSWLR